MKYTGPIFRPLPEAHKNTLLIDIGTGFNTPV